ncbi:MAG: proline racemase family protein [Gemmatimonadales bacterium]
MTLPLAIEVVDSHTEGEPTRVVVSGWPQPAGATMAERRDAMRATQDHLRRAVVLEPRGHEAVVGALLTPPVRPEAAVGVVFFNDVDYLGMCGHGLIGVVRTLQFLGRITPGTVHVDTPAGPVSAVLADDGEVTIRNVPSYCYRSGVTVEVPGLGTITGDISYGGNWFFLTSIPEPTLDLANRAALLHHATAIRDALIAAGVTGADGALIDHVELFGPPQRGDADSRNFVLCPGAAYDRSPCGTGTSAKMAALVAHGMLEPGMPWRQESIVGSRFVGWVEREGDALIPFIRGSAYVTASTTLRFDPADPFRLGLS